MVQGDPLRIKDDLNEGDKITVLDCTLVILYDNDHRSSLLLKSLLNLVMENLSLRISIQDQPNIADFRIKLWDNFAHRSDG